MPLYFAYGSNMDQDQMRERCPDARLMGVASLPDYRLAFTIYSPKRKCGCADIVSAKGEAVYGLLYELTEKDMEALDGYEAHPTHYRRIPVTVLNDKGKPTKAEAYEVVDKKEGLVPSEHYLGLMKKAARKYGFQGEYQ